MKISLSGTGGRTFEVSVAEVVEHDPTLIPAIIDLDLLTFSEPTWSRYTAGLLLRHGRTFLLQADGAIIGTCQLLRSWSTPQEAVLFSMSIRPGWRGRGLGTFFLEEVIHTLLQGDIHSLVLEVDPENEAAIKLYEQKFGFVRQKVCDQEYGPGQDRLHMRKTLERDKSNYDRSTPSATAGSSVQSESDQVPHCRTDSESDHISPSDVANA